MTATALPVPHGTAEALARLGHFRNLVTVQAEELDAVAHFLLGDVGDHESRAAIWENLRDDCQKLWHLISDDWDTDDLDEIPEADWARHSFATWQQEEDHRFVITRERLAGGIENLVRLSRLAAVEARRARRSVA